jgi:hypothetical protein
MKRYLIILVLWGSVQAPVRAQQQVTVQYIDFAEARRQYEER